MLRALQSPVVSVSNLAAFDSHFNACWASFGPTLQPDMAEPLDVRALPPLCLLSNCRLILNRHNLSPSAPRDVRIAALDACLASAKTSAMLLKRVQSRPDDGQRNWKTMLFSCAPAALGMHIWRCTLTLCLRGSFAEAMICVTSLSALGNKRVGNVACGRYLAAFLRLLLAKVQDNVNLDEDEELLAWVSGDLQGSLDAWIWQPNPTVAASRSSSPVSETGVEDLSKWHGLATPPSEAEWAGWDEIVMLIHELSFLRDAKSRQVSSATSEGAKPLACMSIANII